MNRYDDQIISVHESANALWHKCLQILATHSLSWCDMTFFLLGISKGIILKYLVTLLPHMKNYTVLENNGKAGVIHEWALLLVFHKKEKQIIHHEVFATATHWS